MDTSVVYPMFMGEVTFNADDRTIERAREVALSEGKTLEGVLYDWLISYAWSKVSGEEIEALFQSLKHVNAGRKFTRHEMNER